MNTKQKIEALFNRNISAYAIAKESGVSQTSVNNLKRGQYDLNKISLGNAEKLANMYDRYANGAELNGASLVVKKLLELEFKEILENQLDVYNDEKIADDKLVFWVLRELFTDVLNDNVKIVELTKFINVKEKPRQAIIDEI